MISIKFLNKFSELFLGLRMLQLCYTSSCFLGWGGGGLLFLLFFGGGFIEELLST